jgi:hypothetical protein
MCASSTPDRGMYDVMVTEMVMIMVIDEMYACSDDEDDERDMMMIAIHLT